MIASIGKMLSDKVLVPMPFCSQQVLNGAS